MLPAVNPPAELTVRHRANPRLEVRLRRLPRDEEARQDAGGLTPSLVHGLTYGAAHWSLASFYNSDPSAADYIRAIRDDSSTPQPIREALQNLDSKGSTSSGNWVRRSRRIAGFR
jgi:hypothetical protein